MAVSVNWVYLHLAGGAGCSKDFARKRRASVVLQLLSCWLEFGLKVSLNKCNHSLFCLHYLLHRQLLSYLHLSLISPSHIFSLLWLFLSLKAWSTIFFVLIWVKIIQTEKNQSKVSWLDCFRGLLHDHLWSVYLSAGRFSVILIGHLRIWNEPRLDLKI